jgi:hypothetical protein
VTAPNGEIDVLDPANYGALTITGPVSIEGHGWASIAAVSGSAAITINANTGDKINIIGVVLDGIAIASTTGIQFNNGGNLTVRDSVIRNFTSNGINFAPNASNVTQLFMSNTLVSDNGGNGIAINAISSPAPTGVLDHVQIENNAVNGLYINILTEGNINVTVTDSVSANNGTNGIFATCPGCIGNPQETVMVRNSTIANNGTDGLEASGSPLIAGILVTRSTITGNTTGWVGKVSSYADDNIDGNGSANTEPPSLLSYK